MQTSLLHPNWRSTESSLRTKLRIFKCNVKAVLLHECETWKVAESIAAKIQAFTNRCKVELQIKGRHTLRKSQTAAIERQVLNWNPQGSAEEGTENNGTER